LWGLPATDAHSVNCKSICSHVPCIYT
jgi:hypothetical protein